MEPCLIDKSAIQTQVMISQDRFEEFAKPCSLKGTIANGRFYLRRDRIFSVLLLDNPLLFHISDSNDTASKSENIRGSSGNHKRHSQTSREKDLEKKFKHEIKCDEQVAKIITEVTQEARRNEAANIATKVDIENM